MTREQAINYLISSGFNQNQVSEIVRALTYEPTTKNDLGVDCIDRAELLKAVDTWDKFGYLAHVGLIRLGKENKYYVQYVRYEDMVNCVKCMPSVTPQPRKGHWVANAPQYDMLNPQYICSECGNAHTRTTPYCEMCGAKMEVEDNG